MQALHQPAELQCAICWFVLPNDQDAPPAVTLIYGTAVCPKHVMSMRPQLEKELDELDAPPEIRTNVEHRRRENIIELRPVKMTFEEARSLVDAAFMRHEKYYWMPIGEVVNEVYGLNET